jgi:hypothetical protein
LAFTDTGNGLRPFSPVYLNARRDPVPGDVNLSWIRRTRLGGDAWLSEVPLGEEIEAYDVLVMSGSTALRTTRVASPALLYTAAEQSADFGSLPASITWRVAQVSRVYGRGVASEQTSIL